MVTNSEINQFKKKGFFIKKNFFKKDYIYKVLREVAFIKKDNSKNFYKYYEKSILNKNKLVLVRVENFYQISKILTKLIEKKLINQVLSKILKGKAVIFKEKINFKPSGCRADLLHQDSQAGWNKYTKNFINVLISLEKSTRQNGCLIFDVSGNNCNKLINNKMKPLKRSELKKPNFKKLLLNVGDIVFFNSFIPHCSSFNKSNKGRSQIYLTYNKAKDGNHRTKYMKEKLKTFPPNNLRSKTKNYTYRV